MKRRLFNLLVGLSLFLCVLTTALWVRSYWVEDFLGYARNDPAQLHRSLGGMDSDSGHLMIDFWFKDFNATPRAAAVARRGIPGNTGWLYDHQEAGSSRVEDEYSFWVNRGFHVGYRLRMSAMDTYTEFSAPHWALVTVFAPLPSIWLIRFFRRRSLSSAGLCASCGYDLRATPERCPECGAVVAKRKITAS